MTDIVFPPMSNDHPDATGVVATWYVEDGERVAADQLIAEVQLDKVDLEVLAPHDGTVHLAVEEGAEVAQGAQIATVI